jgi:hypothetical protein
MLMRDPFNFGIRAETLRTAEFTEKIIAEWKRVHHPIAKNSDSSVVL